MAQVTVALPRLLADMIGGVRREQVVADHVAGALDAVCTRHPALRVHLFDDASRLRPHVTCLLNGEVARDTLDRLLTERDEVTILQAVSGG